MLELHFTTLPWMRPIEIERKRIEELELLVVLEQSLVLDPGRRLRVLGEFSLESLLTIDLATEHSLRQRSVVRRGSCRSVPRLRARSARCRAPNYAWWTSARRT